MITIQQVDKKRISVSAHYCYGSRLEKIPGISELIYSHGKKYGVAPIECLSYIKIAFAGELYFKTPLWKLEGRQRPVKKPIRYLGPVPRIPDLAVTPYEYQKEGICFMIDRLTNEGCVLNGDSVGLGKTLMSSGTLKWFVENRGVRKILIVCKKSIKTQWAEEIRRIADWHRVPIAITGETKKQRMKAYDEIRASRIGILITNYQNFLNDTEEIDAVNPDICIVDEAHCVKKRDGVMNNNISKVISGKRTILLTGTPIMSKPDDIYGIISMASPGFFGEYEEYKERYIHTLNKAGYGEQIVGVRNLDELRDRIQKFLIMRSAADVELELPDRNIKRIVCSMDDTQRKMLDAVKAARDDFSFRKSEYIERRCKEVSIQQAIEDADKREMSFNYLLQYIADDPSAFRYIRRKIHRNSLPAKLLDILPDKYEKSAKTSTILDMVSEIVDSGEKVVVFCHWASPARMLKEHFDKMENANAVMYTGAENQQERDANVYAFRNDPSVNIIIGTEAMAEGLNLQVCPFLINYEQADTHAIREQRIGRICRLGSKYKYINVIDLVTDDSKDEARLSKIENDRDLFSATIGEAV